MLLTKQGGILYPFATLLGWIMNGIFWVIDKIGIPNIGLSIVLFTIVMNVLMLPLTYKQQKFSKLNSKMNPELQVIQEKYKGRTDQESMMAMQEETKAVYAKYGVSPTGSCLQLLIQIPILFSLYQVIYRIPAYVSKVGDVFMVLAKKIVDTDNGAFLLNNSGVDSINRTVANYGKNAAGENLHNGIIDVLNRLSTSDLQIVSDHYGLNTLSYEGNTILSTYEGTRVASQGLIDHFNTFLGMNIANSPQYTIRTEWAQDAKNWWIIIGVIMIPILSALTQWINTKLMPQPETDKKKGEQENAMMASMKTMNNIMPLMSAFFCFTLPVGIGLYWVTGSVIRGIIQVCINKKIDHINIEEMVKKNIEKENEKRRKQGLPPQQISNNALKNAKNVNSSYNASNNENSLKSKEELKAKVKESTDYYKNVSNAKEGSLASKALMVKHYNEKNKKND